MSCREAIVVGAGPAGLSACRALLDEGCAVELVDAGRNEESTYAPGPFLEKRRRDLAQWRLFLGPTFEGAAPVAPASPKFRVPHVARWFAEATRDLPLELDDFVLGSILGSGGLSRAWGAGVSEFDDRELQRNRLPVADMRESYRRVGTAMGISGCSDDELSAFFGSSAPLQAPVDLGPIAQGLWRRYRRRSPSGRVMLGRSRNAVLTVDGTDRSSCSRCGMCLWGCSEGAIYDGRQELAQLQRRRGFTYRPRHRVERLEEAARGDLRLSVEHRGERFEMSARRVLLAAGTIHSTLLVAESLNYQGRLPLRSPPALAIALLDPLRLGRSYNEHSFALAQLSLLTQLGDAGDCFGNLFGTHGLLLSSFAERSPFGLPATRAALRVLLPSMLVGNCFLDARHSAHVLEVPGDGRAVVRGGFAPTFEATRRQVASRLRAFFLRLGLVSLPGSGASAPPGSDLHYAGTLPVVDDPRRPGVSEACEIHGLPGVYLVDGSVLASLPGKAHTLTLMANADRVGRQVGSAVRRAVADGS